MIQKALSADHDVAIAETNRRGHAARIAQGATANGTDVVVAFGGDGTINEAANGVAGTTTALAPLPGGSTNVFARAIGLPNDPIEATGSLRNALASDEIRRVGLGRANGRYFLFHVGIGFDAAVVGQVERRAAMKRYAGHALFVYATFSTWFRHYDRSRPRFAVRHDDGSIVDDGYFAVCLNASPYTYLGNQPLQLSPHAALERQLAMVTFRTLGLSKILWAGRLALGGGGLGRLAYVDEHADVADIVVKGHAPFPYQVDGDYLGEVERLVLTHEPDALRLVTPSRGE